MDAGGEVAQLADRRLRVGERAVDQLAGAGRVGVEALARELQLDHQRHEPLLRAVVEVAAEPAALGVARVDEPRPRRAQRLQPRAQLHLQARVLEREPRRRGRLDDELGRLGQHRGVQQAADAPALVVDLGQHCPGSGSASGRPSRVT